MQFGAEIIVAAEGNARDLERRIFGNVAGERADDIAVIAGRFDAILAQRRAKVAQPVEDAKHAGDERGVSGAVAAPHLIERILGGMRQGGNARQGQKARAALDRVDEPENGVELRAVGGVRLPRDNGPAGFGKDFRRFGQKVVQQIVHEGVGSPQKSRLHHGAQWLRRVLLVRSAKGKIAAIHSHLVIPAKAGIPLRPR